MLFQHPKITGCFGTWILWISFQIWDVIRNPLTNSIIFQDGHIAPPTRWLDLGRQMSSHTTHVSWQWIFTSRIAGELSSVENRGTGWWFVRGSYEPNLVGGLEHGFYDFPYIWKNHPTDELTFFRGVGRYTTNQKSKQYIGDDHNPSGELLPVYRDDRRFWTQLHWHTNWPALLGASAGWTQLNW